MSNSQNTPVLRFAPSPNGYLHAGHAYSALLNARIAKRLGGRLLLRFEDIDTTRCRPEYEAAALEDLAWLGLAFDEAPRRQSEQFDDYRAAIGRLTAMGLTYPCFCSRAQIAVAAKAVGKVLRDPDGALVYPGTCRHMSPAEAEARIATGEPHALRLRMDAALSRIGRPLTMRRLNDDLRVDEAEVLPERWGDVVIARKETPTSYHVSVVVDDALQGVTHVVRGRDLEAATAVHRVLQSLWALPEPDYLHHDLVRDEAGDKLAKSMGSRPLRQWRADGMSGPAMRELLGFAD